MRERALIPQVLVFPPSGRNRPLLTPAEPLRDVSSQKTQIRVGHFLRVRGRGAQAERRHGLGRGSLKTDQLRCVRCREHRSSSLAAAPSKKI